ncbi:DNA polymerase III alpha subunit (EC 2.7.7.7) (plasmid) [Mycetohabitans rhizoxinica HKI 454]|uniref:DNA polymerase III alpha subunit n=1 Tax=Mycetohabitans rhizoxinica (strain DSM 19002 / CIP 109453 / HKI 454) TaxID=882378 RepID=E5AV50_MYCRK|nr:DNA polymerase III alpha subunit (EC 2.7.7.7) [Mycetohabitans rhizoxinica HKI 454]
MVFEISNRILCSGFPKPVFGQCVPHSERKDAERTRGMHTCRRIFERALIIEQWATLAATLLGFPRHLSQHSGGFVISRGKPSRLVPIESAAMPDRSVIQWDKNDIDALELLKIDILALGMLPVIRRALALVAPSAASRSSCTISPPRMRLPTR